MKSGSLASFRAAGAFGDEDRDEPLVINLLQDRMAPVLRGNHVHTCPECSTHVPCQDACGCFEDMRLDDGRERGGFVVCDQCQEVTKEASEDVEEIEWASMNEGPPALPIVESLPLRVGEPEALLRLLHWMLGDQYHWIHPREDHEHFRAVRDRLRQGCAL